ncbi:hypothetical protein EDB83DRAFT_2549921 [Lactarius deliciosus]|nr:hypothetical protein EDB83DRAFT_2549921 [Lactarius deliciosus]
MSDRRASLYVLALVDGPSGRPYDASFSFCLTVAKRSSVQDHTNCDCVFCRFGTCLASTRLILRPFHF